MQRDSVEMNRARENNLGLNEMLAGVRQGDSGAIAQFVMYYHKSIQTVVHDVITDPDIAREVTGDTLKIVVNQLQMGVHTGDFEPWLMWRARNNAMMYVQMDRTTVSPEPAPESRYASPEAAPALRYASPEAATESRYAAPEPAPALRYAVSPEPAPALRYAAPEPVPAPRYASPEPAPVLRYAVSPEPAPAPRYASPEAAPVPRYASPEPAPAPRYASPEPASARYAAAPQRSNPASAQHIPDTLSFESEKQQKGAQEPPKEKPTQNKKLHVKSQNQGFRYLDVLIIILMVLVVIFLLWVLIGLLAKLNIFTIPDLGYNWFNSHLIRLF